MIKEERETRMIKGYGWVNDCCSPYVKKIKCVLFTFNFSAFS